MAKFKIINLVDKVFVTFCVFLIIFAWINFFIRNLFLTFFLSLIFSAALLFILFYFLNKKKAKLNNIINYNKDMEEKFLAFRLLSKNEKLKLLNEILKQSYPTTLEKNFLTYHHDGKKAIILLASHLEKITQHDLINLVEGCENFDEIKIICIDENKSLNLNIFNKTTIELISKKSLYDNFFLKHSIYPKTDMLSNKKTKLKLKEILRNFITKNKAKSYFFCGLILLVSSLILPYHYYYLIFGTLLLSLSILCRMENTIFN